MEEGLTLSSPFFIVLISGIVVAVLFIGGIFVLVFFTLRKPPATTKTSKESPQSEPDIAVTSSSSPTQSYVPRDPVRIVTPKPVERVPLSTFITQQPRAVSHSPVMMEPTRASATPLPRAQAPKPPVRRPVPVKYAGRGYSEVEGRENFRQNFGYYKKNA